LEIGLEMDLKMELGKELARWGCKLVPSSKPKRERVKVKETTTVLGGKLRQGPAVDMIRRNSLSSFSALKRAVVDVGFGEPKYLDERPVSRHWPKIH